MKAEKNQKKVAFLQLFCIRRLSCRILPEQEFFQILKSADIILCMFSVSSKLLIFFSDGDGSDVRIDAFVPV